MTEFSKNTFLLKNVNRAYGQENYSQTFINSEFKKHSSNKMYQISNENNKTGTEMEKSEK